MRRWKLFIGAPVVGLGVLMITLFILAVNEGCGCLPSIREEVPLSTVPAPLLDRARARHPGFVPARAWIIRHYDGVSDRPLSVNYKIRSRTGWWTTTDDTFPMEVPSSEPTDLAPIHFHETPTRQ